MIQPANISESDIEFLNRLEKLDLRPIVFKLVKDPDSGIPWTEKDARLVEIEYRQFLFLYWKYGREPRFTVAPSKRVDMFWHQHILDTEKYKQDCELLFSTPMQTKVCQFLRNTLKPLKIDFYAGYMPHFPYLGLRGKDDVEALEEAFIKAKSLISLHFPESN